MGWDTDITDGFTDHKAKISVRFCSLRRSGSHAVLNWLASLWRSEPICFVNDVGRKKGIALDQPSNTLPSLTENAVGLHNPHSVLIHSYEDERLRKIANHPFAQEHETAKRKINVLLLRDPYNLFASRLRIMRDRPGNGSFRDMLMTETRIGLFFLPKLWKFYAKEFLGETNRLRGEKIPVNFSKWVDDAQYRRSLCRALGVEPDDSEKNRVPRIGFGSSFDRCRFDGRADRMKLDERWKSFVGDPVFDELIEDDELRELSDRIFGEVMAGEHR